MSVQRKITTVGGTIACALGIGYFMQQGDARSYPAPAPAAKIEPVQNVELESVDPATDVALDLEQITLTSAQPAEQPLPIPLQTASVLPTGLSGVVADAALPVVGCDIAIDAKAGPLASVKLSVSAPCSRNERLTVHHNGMMFTETTDDAGKLGITIPALAKHAVFIVEFSNGEGAVAVADVPQLDEFDRIALQWAGNGGFQVHAREFGAAYGEKGHVWSGSAHLEGAETDLTTGGYVMRLGDAATLAPKLAEVYTFPSRRALKSGSVVLSVETEVTQANCGRDISAQTLELRGAESLHTRDLVLAMPDCSQIGDFLVLNNLVADLMIASK